MRANRFTILSVPIDECEQCFWFVFDTQNRRSLEMRSFRDAGALCNSLNDGDTQNVAIFNMLVTSAKAFAV
jgi:hypothetical protein